MTEAYKRHNISDTAWGRLEPHLSWRKGTWGGNARDNRRFINAVFGFCERVHLGAICRIIQRPPECATGLVGNIIGNNYPIMFNENSACIFPWRNAT